MSKKRCAWKYALLISVLSLQALSPEAQDNNISRETKKTNTDQQQLLALEYNWLKAEFALDTAYLSGLMDESFMGISANGIAGKQEELLDYYKTITGRLRDSILIDSFRLENTIVNLYGNTAVITFIVHTFRKEKGLALERKTRFYDVWIKRNGKWKAVASQGTKVAE